MDKISRKSKRMYSAEMKQTKPCTKTKLNTDTNTNTEI